MRLLKCWKYFIDNFTLTCDRDVTSFRFVAIWSHLLTSGNLSFLPLINQTWCVLFLACDVPCLRWNSWLKCYIQCPHNMQSSLYWSFQIKATRPHNSLCNFLIAFGEFKTVKASSLKQYIQPIATFCSN